LPPREWHDLYGSVLEFAAVRPFAAGGGDVAGLLCRVRPDALIDASAARALGGWLAYHGQERVKRPPAAPIPWSSQVFGFKAPGYDCGSGVGRTEGNGA
jgi:hypothetical protein